MVSVCLPSDTLSQHLLSYLGFSYLGCGLSLHSSSSKVQLLLFTLDGAYLLTTTPPDLECRVAPLGPPAPMQPLLLGCGVAPLGLTLCYPMDCGLPGSSVREILQAKNMEWVAMPSSRGSSWLRDQTRISRGSWTAGRFFTTEPPGKPSEVQGKVKRMKRIEDSLRDVWDNIKTTTFEL